MNLFDKPIERYVYTGDRREIAILEEPQLKDDGVFEYYEALGYDADTIRCEDGYGLVADVCYAVWCFHSWPDEDGRECYSADPDGEPDAIRFTTDWIDENAEIW